MAHELRVPLGEAPRLRNGIANLKMGPGRPRFGQAPRTWSEGDLAVCHAWPAMYHRHGVRQCLRAEMWCE